MKTIKIFKSKDGVEYLSKIDNNFIVLEIDVCVFIGVTISGE